MTRFFLFSLAALLCVGCHHNLANTEPPMQTQVSAPVIHTESALRAFQIDTKAEIRLVPLDYPPAFAEVRVDSGDTQLKSTTASSEIGELPLLGRDMVPHKLVPPPIRSEDRFAPPASGAHATPLQVRVETWFAHLLNGGIQYKVPTTMYWREASTVTVVIEGSEAPTSSELTPPTGSGTLKVSDRMRVVLSCPDNPDEFTITPESGVSDVQYIPVNASTTWNWSVTPKYTGRSQKLQISAWVLYPGQDDKIAQQLPVYKATIDIHIPNLSECLTRMLEGDPAYWLKFGLPGGSGFALAAGMVTWARKRGKSDDKPKPTQKKKRHETAKAH